MQKWRFLFNDTGRRGRVASMFDFIAYGFGIGFATAVRMIGAHGVSSYSGIRLFSERLR